MKLKYMKGRVPLGLLCAVIGVFMFIGASRSTDKGLGYVLLSGFIGALFILLAIAAFIIPAIIDRKEMENIEKVQIADISAKTSTGSAIARGAVGDMIAGPTGAVLGASTAKQNRTTTFIITYKNGKVKKKVVPNDAPDYNRYIKLI